MLLAVALNKAEPMIMNIPNLSIKAHLLFVANFSDDTVIINQVRSLDAPGPRNPLSLEAVSLVHFP
jgi:hypothetical protein